jgi:uncharacterized protein (TIGR03067 family)
MAATSVETAALTRPRTDLEQLQGAWVAIAGRRPARLLVAGSRFTFEFQDGDSCIYMGTFALDSDASPRRMDMHVEEGPAEARGRVAFCIYHVDGDILRWCPTRPGGDTRLTGFPGTDDERFHCTVFKHARPRRS